MPAAEPKVLADLLEISQTLASALDIRSALGRVLEHIEQSLGAVSVTIALREADGDDLTVEAAVGAEKRLGWGWRGKGLDWIRHTREVILRAGIWWSIGIFWTHLRGRGQTRKLVYFPCSSGSLETVEKQLSVRLKTFRAGASHDARQDRHVAALQAPRIAVAVHPLVVAGSTVSGETCFPKNGFPGPHSPLAAGFSRLQSTL